MVDLNKIANKVKAIVAEDIKDKQELVSTGNLAFDLTTDGGLPFGYVIEFLGKSQSGKSLLLQSAMADAQKKYKAIAVLVDRENAFFKKRAIELGIDSSNLLLAKPATTPLVVDAFNFILSSIEEIRKQDSNAYIIIGIDSVSAFDKDVALEKSDSGRKAKSFHEGLRKLLTVLDEKIMLIVANQVTFNTQVVFGDKRATSAGESIKYYGTVRIALEEKKKIIDEKRGNEVMGTWIDAEVVKTRLGPCYRSCTFPFFYKEGIPYYGGIARLLVDRNIMKPANKEEFKRFKSNIVVYNKEKINEFNIEEFLKKHKEIDLSKYPEWQDDKESNSKEEEE